MTPPTSSGFGTTMRTSRKSYSRKTLTHVSPGSMISSSTSDSDNSLHSLYFTSYHGLINYPQKIPAHAARQTENRPRRLARRGSSTSHTPAEQVAAAVGTPWPVSRQSRPGRPAPRSPHRGHPSPPARQPVVSEYCSSSTSHVAFV